MLIAVDMTGADKGPNEVYEGIRLALLRNQTLRVIPTGPKELIHKLIAEFGDRIQEGYDTDVVNTPKDTVRDLLRKKDSATAKAIGLLVKNESLNPENAKHLADAGVFFGDTKAAVFWASIGREHGGLDLIQGVKRPPLALTMPTFGGKRKVYLDAGVSVDGVTAEMLWQFAWLGWAFAQVELGIAEPRVALHSNGEEPEKGDKLTKEAFALFTQRELPGFVGHNAQMTDLVANEVDVLVSEGFGGNKSFKSVEAGFRVSGDSLKRNCKMSIRTKIGAWLMKPCFAAMKAEIDPSEFGCQPLLGVDDAIVGIGHGSADRFAIAKGIEKAVHFAEIRLAERVKALVEEALAV